MSAKRDSHGQPEKAERNTGGYASGLPLGIAMGIGIGVALGVAMGNMGVGIAIGIAIGAGMVPVFALAWTARSKPDNPGAADGRAPEEETDK